MLHNFLRFTPCSLAFAGLLVTRAWAGTPPVDDGFEGKKIDEVWSVEQSNPGAIFLQGANVHGGKGALQITIRSRDRHGVVDRDAGKDTEWDEIQESAYLIGREGEGAEYAFSVYLPADFPQVPGKVILAEWKQHDRDGVADVSDPVLALRYSGGELQVTLQTGRERARKILFRTADEVRGRWLDLIFQLRFARTGDGLVRVSLDGKQVVNFRGSTAYAEKFGYPKKGDFSFRLGIYRDKTTAPMTLYIDDYKKRPLTDAELAN